MNPRIIDRFTPMSAEDGGCQRVTVAGTAKFTELFEVPPDANSAWLQAAADIQFRMDGETVGSAALTLPALSFLPLANRSMLDRLVLIGAASIAVQFGTGDVGPIPPAPIVDGSGGGGGGGVTSVGATWPIESSGGSAPVISLTDAAQREILQWSASGWSLRNTQVNQTIYVDPVYGDDGTGEPENPFRPFQTLDNAEQASEPGTLLVLRAGQHIVQAQRWGMHQRTYLLENASVTGFILNTDGDLDMQIRGTGVIEYGDRPVIELNGTKSRIVCEPKLNGDIVLNGGSLECDKLAAPNIFVDIGTELRAHGQVDSDALTSSGSTTLEATSTIADFDVVGGTCITAGLLNAQSILVREAGKWMAYGSVETSELSAYGTMRVYGDINAATTVRLAGVDILIVGTLTTPLAYAMGGRTAIYGTITVDAYIFVQAAASLSIYGKAEAFAIYISDADTKFYLSGHIAAGQVTTSSAADAMIQGRMDISEEIIVYSTSTMSIIGDVRGEKETVIYVNGDVGIRGVLWFSGTVTGPQPKSKVIRVQGGQARFEGVINGAIVIGTMTYVEGVLTIAGVVNCPDAVAIEAIGLSGTSQMIVLEPNARLVANTGGRSIEQLSGLTTRVVSYNACGNTPIDGGIAVDGTYTDAPYVTYP